MSKEWMYLVVEVTNKGRTISENGVLVKSHTKKLDLTALPKPLWNSKGKEMILEAKGDILSHYGKSGWELVSTQFGEGSEHTYIFKKNE